MKRTKCLSTRRTRWITPERWRGWASCALIPVAGLIALGAPPGPEPQVPAGGGAPGSFPNTSVTAVNVIARGSTTFNSNVEVVGFDGQGPIPWSVNRYNRGDFALRLAPANPVAANESLGRGFIDFADTSPGLAASQAWRPHPSLGVIMPTSRQNGPIDWNDGEGPFYPTIALSEASSGPGYDMVSGAYGNGNLDINTGRAGTHPSSPEANFSFSVAWFPYDEGWLGGEMGNPTLADPSGLPDGSSRWTQPNAHAAGLVPSMVKWLEFPSFTGIFGGLAEVRLPGIDAREDGMLFATSSDGNSAVNIVGVAPKGDGSGWLVTIREDSEVSAEVLASASESEFQFLYISYQSERLVGGQIDGSTGQKRKAVGDFVSVRRGPGTYELTVPGKTGGSGMWLLQAAELEPNTSEPLATRAFLSYEYQNDKFVVQSRVVVSDTQADLRDTSFYAVWVDFTDPLSAPAGPRLRSLGPVAVNQENVTLKEANVAAHTTEPEALVTTIDSVNAGFYVDPISGQLAAAALVGRFYDPRTLAPLGDEFVILGNPYGTFTRHDVKFNPVSKQYVVVANARSHGPSARAVPMVALVKSAADAAGGPPVARAFTYQENTAIDFDDVAVAVSSRNGNFLLVAEYKFAGEGEGAVGALFGKDGTLLTAQFGRLDLFQSIGDEDDPDVVYLADRDAFLYLSNTDNSNGSTGPWSNRIVGSIVDAQPDAQGRLVTRPEQLLSDGEPAGQAEGHAVALLNPFNGELIIAYDVGGNNVANGHLSFFNLGQAPDYAFTAARPEVPYLTGSGGDPFKHQHPQLAVNPGRGVVVVGHSATASDVGYPNGYVFRVLGPDGLPLASPFATPTFLAEIPGGISGSPNYHQVVYSPATDWFVTAFNSSPGITYLAGLRVTSDHLPAVQPPTLSIGRSGSEVVLSWPTSAAGYVLEGADSLGPANWADVVGAPTQEGGLNKLTVPATGAARFYRLRK